MSFFVSFLIFSWCCCWSRCCYCFLCISGYSWNLYCFFWFDFVLLMLLLSFFCLFDLFVFLYFLSFFGRGGSLFLYVYLLFLFLFFICFFGFFSYFFLYFFLIAKFFIFYKNIIEKKSFLHDRLSPKKEDMPHKIFWRCIH